MTPNQERLRHYLHSLPQLQPPPGLDRRIGAAHRTRRRRLGAGAAATVLALACLAMSPLLFRDVEPPPFAGGDVLEPAHIDERTLAHVRALDRALQAAYESDASDSEIAPLWVARAQLMNGSSSSPHSN